MAVKAASILAVATLAIFLQGAVAEESEPSEQYSEEDYSKLVSETFDTDNDGKISLIEFTDHIHENSKLAEHPDFKAWSTDFKAADADKNMHLDAEELKAFLKKVSMKSIKSYSKAQYSKIVSETWDSDNDGKISLMEFTDHVHDNPNIEQHPDFEAWSVDFRTADADKDMHLNADELKSFLKTIGKKSVERYSKEQYSKIISETWDTDNDGKVSLMEFTDHVHENPSIERHPDFKAWSTDFKKADADKDMHLNADELKSYLAKLGAKKTFAEITMGIFDTDKDGMVSLHELIENVHVKKNNAAFKGWTQGFKEADKDKDMHLNYEEFEYLFEARKKDHKADSSKWVEDYSKMTMEKSDTDKDGKISLMEFTDIIHDNPKASNLHARFKEADTDQDMHLDADELKAFITTLGKKAKKIKDEM